MTNNNSHGGHSAGVTIRDKIWDLELENMGLKAISLLTCVCGNIYFTSLGFTASSEK